MSGEGSLSLPDNVSYRSDLSDEETTQYQIITDENVCNPPSELPFSAQTHNTDKSRDSPETDSRDTDPAKEPESVKQTSCPNILNQEISVSKDAPSSGVDDSVPTKEPASLIQTCSLNNGGKKISVSTECLGPASGDTNKEPSVIQTSCSDLSVEVPKTTLHSMDQINQQPLSSSETPLNINLNHATNVEIQGTTQGIVVKHQSDYQLQDGLPAQQATALNSDFENDLDTNNDLDLDPNLGANLDAEKLENTNIDLSPIIQEEQESLVGNPEDTFDTELMNSEKNENVQKTLEYDSDGESNSSNPSNYIDEITSRNIVTEEGVEAGAKNMVEEERVPLDTEKKLHSNQSLPIKIGRSAPKKSISKIPGARPIAHYYKIPDPVSS